MTSDEITALHNKYAPSAKVFELVYTHCCIVRDIALQLIDRNQLSLDKKLVENGAMLHDIGVYPLFKADGTLKSGVNYITHGIEGQKILQAENLPEKLWRFASHHTGVGLTKQDIINQKLPLPQQDYLAKTKEELLVMYADKFHSKTTPPYLNSFDWYKNDILRFGQDKANKFEEMAAIFGKPDLEPLSRKYKVEIRQFGSGEWT